MDGHENGTSGIPLSVYEAPKNGDGPFSYEEEKTVTSPSHADEVVMRKKNSGKASLHRQQAVTSENASGSRQPSFYEDNDNLPTDDTTPTLDRKTSLTSPGPSSSSSQVRRFSAASDVSTTRETEKVHYRRQGSNTSERALTRRGGEGEEDRRSSTGHGVLLMSSRSSSRRASENGARNAGAVNHRPSFSNIQGSSTPVQQRRYVESSSDSSSMNFSSPPHSPPPPPPPPPLDEALSNAVESTVTARLPSPPLSPPLPPPPPPPEAEGFQSATENLREESLPPLFQPRPPSVLSAHPLPTPPPTPLSSSDGASLFDDLHSIPPQNLPTPPPTPPLPSPPHVSGPPSASSFSSPGKELDFLSFLPDDLPADNLEGHRPIRVEQSLTPEAQMMVDEQVTNISKAEGQRTMDITSMTAVATPESQGSPISATSMVATEEIYGATDTTAASTATPDTPVIHFPPPPDYSPSLSPTLQTARITSTETDFSAGRRETSLSAPDDADHRLASTSTDVILGFFDHTLASYASTPVTPVPSRSASNVNTPYLPESDHEDQKPNTFHAWDSPLTPDSVLGFNVDVPPASEDQPDVTPASHDQYDVIPVSQDQPSLTPPSPNQPDVDRPAAYLAFHDQTDVTPASQYPLDVTPVSSNQPATKEMSTAVEVNVTSAPLELLQVQKKKKTGNQMSKRKLTPAHVTKYEGSVKTVRRQIKPGHVEELREIFIQQEDDDGVLRRGKRRTKPEILNDDHHDGSGSGSGYTSMSSDNEYDLETAEKINSPDYSSTSPFPSKRAFQYGLNWEKAITTTVTTPTCSTSHGESSEASTPKAKRVDRAFVFEKDVTQPDVSVGYTVAGHASLPHSVPSLSTFLTADDFSASRPPPLDLQQGEQNANAYAEHSEIGDWSVGNEDGDASMVSPPSPPLPTTTTTAVLFPSAATLKTRSSSSEEDDTEKQGLVDAGEGELLVSLGSNPAALSTVPTSDASVFLESVLTGSVAGSSQPCSTHDDRNDFSDPALLHPPAQTSPPRSDGRNMSDADCAANDNSSHFAKVTMDGETREVESGTVMEVTGGGKSGFATGEDSDDPVTKYWPNDRDNESTGVRRKEVEAQAILTTAIPNESGTNEFHTGSSSTTYSWTEDSIFTRAATGEVTGLGSGPVDESQPPGSESNTVTQIFTVTRDVDSTATAELSPRSLSSPEEKQQETEGSADFLSILDNIQLQSDSFSAETAQRAKQLHEVDFKGSNRSSLEVSIPEVSEQGGNRQESFITLDVQHAQKAVKGESEYDLQVEEPETTDGADLLTTANVNADVKHDDDKREGRLSASGSVNSRKESSDDEESNGSSDSESNLSRTFLIPAPLASSPPIPSYSSASLTELESSTTNAGPSTTDGEVVLPYQSKQSLDNDKKEDDSSSIRDKMTAVVGELNSFTIRRLAEQQQQLSHSSQSSSLSTSSASSSTLSRHSVEKGTATTTPSLSSPGTEENAGDVCVYRDSRGDVYVMQDITDHPHAATTTAATTAIVKSAYDDDNANSGHSFDFQGLNRNDSLTVDTKGVDVKKAKEIISAFLTDGSTTTTVQSGDKLREGTSVNVRSIQNELLSKTSDRRSGFEMVAGNVGVGGQGTAVGHHTYDIESSFGPHRPEQMVTEYNTQPQSSPSRRRNSSVTVSTTSAAVVGEQSEMQVHIPRHAVPVLPISRARLNSIDTTSSITPMVLDVSQSNLHPISPTSSSPSQAAYTCLTFNPSRSQALDESDLDFGDRTYMSQTTLERSPFGSGTNFGLSVSQDGLFESRSVDLPRLRRVDESSLSSEEGGERRTQYKVSSLTRTDSNTMERSYATTTSMKNTTMDRGSVYDSAFNASQSVYSKAPYTSKVTVINNVNAPTHTNASFGENDSQYGSQTSKTTSGGDMSPTDDHLYRIVRVENSLSAPTSPNATSSPPVAFQEKTTYHNVRDKLSTASTADYKRGQLDRSHEGIFTRNDSYGSKAADVWRVDRLSRNEPRLNLPMLSKSLSTLPRAKDEVEEEETEAQRYRLVSTGHSWNEKVRTPSISDSDGGDSGVDGDGKRYRTVSSVRVHGAPQRSSSTGSIRETGLSLPPQSPSPPLREYRVSSVQRQSSWERRREAGRDTADQLFRVTRVLSSDDLPKDLDKKKKDNNNSNNNGVAYHPVRVVQTLPTVSSFREAQSFDENLTYVPRKSTSTPRRIRTVSHTPGERHRTVVTLNVGDDKNLPTTHHTETEGQQYRVVNVKSSGPSTKDAAKAGVYTVPGQSYSSPVSGYESDVERHSSSSSSKVYGFNTSVPHHRHHSHHQEPPRKQRPSSYVEQTGPSSPGKKRYIVSKTLHTSNLDDKSERGLSRDVRPTMASPPSSPPQSPTGEWHKTTIDISRNVNRRTHNVREGTAMAPSEQKQTKSYIIFNRPDTVTDTKYNGLSTVPPPESPSTHTFTSERQFRVISPTPTTTSTSIPPYRGPLSGDFHVNVDRPTPQRSTLMPSTLSDEVSFSRQVYEEKSQFTRREPSPVMPEADQSGEEADLRVLRGKILIQNRLDESRDQDDFLDNMNVFDNSFHLGKDNPLYQSDPDIYKSLEAEVQEGERRSQVIGQEVTQDITWETVDRIAQRHKGGQG